MKMIKNPEKILIIRLSAIGDVVDVLPALRCLRSNFPESKISWLIEDRASAILSDHPDLNDIIVFPRKKWQREILKASRAISTVSEILSFYRKLHDEHYDLVLDFQGNLKSGIMDLITGADNRVGFGKGFSKEFNYLFTRYRVLPQNKREHRINKNLSLIKGIGFKAEFQNPEFPRFKPDQEYISKFIDENNKYSVPLIIVNPCTSEYGSYKRWSTLNYAKLTDMILEKYDVKVVFIWGPNELEIVNEIISYMKQKALASCKTTIKQLIELIRRADLYIGGDTGPLHIASTLRIPTVAIFGPKDPTLYGPYHENTAIINKELPCSPCRNRTCSDPECLTSISPEEVFQAVIQLIDKYVDSQNLQLEY